MDYKNVFKRYELKYLITKKQMNDIIEYMSPYTQGDKYGRSSICNLYFDTLDYRLIRRSIEKPVYKEKLRLRSYGVANENSDTFIELKKKYDCVVYKRRIDMTEHDAMDYLSGSAPKIETQITNEINYFLDYYEKLSPAVFLSYDRQAFFSKNDPEFRITFDENILWRDYDLSLCKGIYGYPIIGEDMALMELKTPFSIPVWMADYLNENKIFRTSFSKYGKAYQSLACNKNIGGLKYA